MPGKIDQLRSQSASMSPRLAFALDAAHKAAQSTLAYYGTGTQVDLKADKSPLTQADRGAEAILRELISKAYPGETILGEEEGLTGESTSRWIIDPIDGTKSFVAGVPLYSTLLGWEEEGEPTIGIAIFPALGEAYYAERGQGAFLNGRPIRVSEEKMKERAIFCHGGIKNVAETGMLDGLVRVSGQVMATRTWCDAYGHAMVASGRAHAMIDPVVSHWDVSPVLPILLEAGAICQNRHGGNALDPIHPGGECQIISAAPNFADWLVNELNS